MKFSCLKFTEPKVKLLADNCYELTEDFIVLDEVTPDLVEQVACVPSGFKFDGASIPRFLWRVCGHPLEAPRIYSAIVHDYHYSLGDVPRAEADELYYAMLRALGVSWIKAKAEYYAIRMFGGSHYASGD